MKLFDSWKGWRQYLRLDDAHKKIVFYSESGQDWHFFELLIRELLCRHDEKITYISSDASDPGLSLQHDNYVSLYIPEGLFLIIHFQLLKARVMVLTMMDLGNLQLKTSINPVHYIYIFHSMGSTHMVDHANSYDAYDSLFCVGPHHVAELRRREALSGIKARNLFEYGHPRLEQLLEAGRRKIPPAGDGPPVVLLAPTWGSDSILNRCGCELIENLLDAGVHVIMRPHYQTMKLTPNVIDQLLDRFEGHPGFESVMHMGETDSLFRSDVLVSDWSAMAIEYFLGLEKPVLFIDLPRRIRNPDWEAWGLEPLEVSIRPLAGQVLDPDQLERAGTVVTQLAGRKDEFREIAATMRDQIVFNPGTSVALGAAEIARLANAAEAVPGSWSQHD